MKYLAAFEKFINGKLDSKHYVTSFPYPRKTSEIEELQDHERAELEEKDDAQKENHDDKQDTKIDE